MLLDGMHLRAAKAGRIVDPKSLGNRKDDVT